MPYCHHYTVARYDSHSKPLHDHFKASAQRLPKCFMEVYVYTLNTFMLYNLIKRFLEPLIHLYLISFMQVLIFQNYDPNMILS